MTMYRHITPSIAGYLWATPVVTQTSDHTESIVQGVFALLLGRPKLFLDFCSYELSNPYLSPFFYCIFRYFLVQYSRN